MVDRKRSRAYPGVSLQDSISNLRMVSAAIGQGANTRLDIAIALGSERETGATSRKIATMIMFGLVQKSGEGYSITSLGKKILRPLPGEEMTLLKEAFLSAPLFADILERFGPEKRIPEALGRILERSFEIVAPNGDYAARIFMESARHAGIVDPERNLLSATGETDLEEQFDEQEDGEGVEANPQDELKTPPPSSTNPPSIKTSITLLNPFAVFETSASLTSKQKKRLEEWLEQVVKPWIKFNLIEEELDELEKEETV